MYKLLPEDEPSCSKHVEDNVKIKTLVQKRCILFVYIIIIIIIIMFLKG